MYRKPHLSIYKDKTTSGFDINGKLGAHVADLNNEGSSPRDLWVPAIQNQRGRIEDIFFYVDRCEDGLKVMDSLRLNHDSVVHLNRNAWEYLHKNGTITREIYVSLRERLENKDAWARRMLRSEGGTRTLKELLINPKTTGKAKKIIFVTYSDMTKEIEDRLHKQENFSLHEMLTMAE
jgi:hypothetical protein